MQPIIDIPLSARAAQEIREKIVTGAYEQGRKLTEQECAQKLGLSRISVREAFQQLVSEGLLVKRVNRSTTVARYGRADVKDVYYLRMSLEKLAARICAEENRTPRDALLRLQERMRGIDRHEADAVEQMLAEDLRYHALMIEAAQSPRLMAAWAGIEGQIRTLSYQTLERYTAQTDDSRVFDDHRLLTEALLSGDRARADAAIEEHLGRSIRLLWQIVDDVQAQGDEGGA